MWDCIASECQKEGGENDFRHGWLQRSEDVFSDYTLMHSTFNAPPAQITCDTAVAATIISLLWLPLAQADERPSGIPDEGKYVKVDRITDGDTIVLLENGG